jgi:hypothetical protein
VQAALGCFSVSMSQASLDRLLSYFLGPHIDMSLFIDEREKDRAQVLIREYYGGIGWVNGQDAHLEGFE